MTNKEFSEIVQDQLDYCKKLLCVKGDEYDANSNDRLHSFKVAAEIQCETPKQSLAGMMAKHTISIYDMCMSSSRYSLEKWEEKITDSINYLLLLKAMVIEDETNRSQNSES